MQLSKVGDSIKEQGLKHDRLCGQSVKVVEALENGSQLLVESLRLRRLVVLDLYHVNGAMTVAQSWDGTFNLGRPKCFSVARTDHTRCVGAFLSS